MERVLRIGLDFPGPSPLTSSLLFCVPHSSFRTGQVHSGVDNRSSGLRPNRTGSETMGASVSLSRFLILAWRALPRVTFPKPAPHTFPEKSESRYCFPPSSPLCSSASIDCLQCAFSSVLYFMTEV